MYAGECHQETYSWWHFTSDQMDPYWIQCTLAIPHKEHEDENTGLKWNEEIVGIDNVDDLKPEPVEMDIQPVGLMMQHQDQARLLVFEYVKAGLEKTDNTEFNEYDVYAVWFTYTLGNWKCLISTTLPDGMYYEVTHNFAKDETYVDAYKKFDNFKISNSDFDEGCRLNGPKMTDLFRRG